MSLFSTLLATIYEPILSAIKGALQPQVGSRGGGFISNR